MKNIFFISIVLISFIITGQEVEKDTLYFKFDREYIQIYDITPDKYYLNDSSDDGAFFFEKIKTYYNLTPKKIVSLKEFVRHSCFYNSKRRRKFDDEGFYNYLGNYTVFLVKEEVFIKVVSNFEIE